MVLEEKQNKTKIKKKHFKGVDSLWKAVVVIIIVNSL